MVRDLSGTAREFCTYSTIMDRARAESQMRILDTLHGLDYGNAAVRQAAAPLDKSLDFSIAPYFSGWMKVRDRVLPTT